MNKRVVSAFSTKESGLLVVMFTLQDLTLKDKVVLIPWLCSVVEVAESQLPRNSFPNTQYP